MLQSWYGVPCLPRDVRLKSSSSRAQEKTDALKYAAALLLRMAPEKNTNSVSVSWRLEPLKQPTLSTFSSQRN